MRKIRVAYCTGFWCTNLGNGFFGMGVEHVLKRVLGAENVTLVSDYQTYTTGYGKRLYPDRKQLEYIRHLDVDYVVLAGPVISKYFLMLWKDTLLALRERGIGYMILSAGTMKLTDEAREEIKAFFRECPPFVLTSRESSLYEEFGPLATHAYDGVCCSFFAPEAYAPSGLSGMGPYMVCNFDKLGEPEIWLDKGEKRRVDRAFDFEGSAYKVAFPRLLSKAMAKTDRFTDALIYAMSVLPAKKRADRIGKYRVIRTDQRFHPHYRRKIYRQNDSFCADLPYGYLNLYANAELTLSDRIHACAATLAFGHSAMLFVKTDRVGLLDRVGAKEITRRPVKLDMDALKAEKEKMVQWLADVLAQA